MSQITIQCRLIAKEPSRQALWRLMAELNTPLINEILNQIANHPDFETWREKRKLPAGIVKQLSDSLKTDPRYIGQPGRFYTSAINLISYIYKSWFKLQQRLQQRLVGQTRWLGILKSDEELVAESDRTLDDIRAQAIALLASLTPENPSPEPKPAKKTKKAKTSTNKPLHHILLDTYEKTEDILTHAAICYLLKNGCKIPTKPEEPQEFAKKRRKCEIKIERLQEQLNSRKPKGRDLTGEKWLQTLITAATTAPENEAQAKSWQNILLTKSKSIPFPVTYETNEDLTWSKNDKGRLCVHFNALGEHEFEIYCDQRQLKWLERFYEDQETKRASKDQHSSALFTLRSGRIGWQDGKGKGEPWNIHRLNLFCTIDTRLWTAEGTEQVRQEKATEIAQTLTKMEQKGDLNDKQQAFIHRRQSTLTRINNPFPRPSQPLYEGKSYILLGIAMGLEKPATAAIINGTTGEALAYRSIKQLLGDNYQLLTRQQKQKQRLSHQRHQAQKNAAPNQFSESELGEYVDRILAKAIVALAKTYQAGSIVVPKVGNMRELVQAEVQAKAEAKIPGYIEAQKKYAKQYRVNTHQWSYGRLIDNIQAQASKIGIVIEQGQQPIRGSPQEKAKEMALLAYQSRSKS